jgi:F-type H+-transporting ATPase subunit delta
MMFSEVSRRYARALYDLAKSKNVADRVFDELRVLGQVYQSDKEIREFLQSPLVSPDQKVKALQGALSGKVSEELLSTLRLLAEKNRLAIFAEVVAAYEFIIDEAHGVTRGVVRSAAPVTADERKRIEETVNKVTKKKVILKFEEDPSLLGGMVTQVGGWTFDDSLKSHLHKLTDVLNRN